MASRLAGWIGSACSLACMVACAPASQGLGTGAAGQPVSTSADASTGATGPDGSTSSVGSISATSASSVDGTTTIDVTTSITMSDEGGNGSTTHASSSDGGGSSSSGDPPAPTYPPCVDAEPRCPEPYEGCIEPMDGAVGNACTVYCNDANECPLPDGGGATVICAAPMMMADFCQLDCSSGSCPDGMVCVGLGPMGQALRCLWPPA